MDFSFSSKDELYEVVKPALEVKKGELDHFGYSYIDKNDIWNYLSLTKWSKAHNLELNDIVNDILTCDNRLIDRYKKNSLSTASKDNNVEIL